MYARLIMFTLGKEKRPIAERMADQFLTAMKSLQGFKNATFIVDEGVGEYGALSMWDSRANAEAAGKALAPAFQQALQGIAQGPPTLRIFEVYEPVFENSK